MGLSAVRKVLPTTITIKIPEHGAAGFLLRL